jgi:protein-S-isoprenylcysteine O-methyltransferase Ste14
VAWGDANLQRRARAAEHPVRAALNSLSGLRAGGRAKAAPRAGVSVGTPVAEGDVAASVAAPPHSLGAMNMDLVPRLVPIASVLLIYLARIAELRTKRDTVKGTVRESVTLRLFIAAGTLMLVGSIGEFLARGPVAAPAPSVALFVGGWAAAVASFALRRRAIRELGKMWSLHVEIRDRHELVRSGPYRWVRHPAYTSMILELASFALLLQSRVTVVVVGLIFVPTLIARIRIEEAALTAQIAGYGEYRRATPALVPYKLPRAVAS